MLNRKHVKLWLYMPNKRDQPLPKRQQLLLYLNNLRLFRRLK